MLSYKKLLSELVKNSGLTLRDIADRCRERGVSIDPSYISKIQTGKQAPPSDEVSRVLAEVLESDPIELIWLGYVEKAPEEIKGYFTVGGTATMSETPEVYTAKTPETICPLMMISSNTTTISILCKKEGCAWWHGNEQGGECAIMTVAISLNNFVANGLLVFRA